MQTLVIDNFAGRLTRIKDGDINSGFAKFSTTYSNDAFVSPGNLSWFEAPSRIDSGGTVITDLIMAMKERVESGVLYVYAIGHTGRLYKIQVNDPTTYNPAYDNPILLATLGSNSPTFTRGGFIDFFGSTERIYIGHDVGVTRIDFDGANETFVGAVGSYTQNVPRPLRQFVGNLYFGNGSNIGEISVSATVSTYGKLSPAFPGNTQVRDMDVSTDGNYLDIVVSRLALPDLTATTQDTTITANSESYIFRWNGTDTGYTAFTTFPSFSLTANTTFGDHQYTFGYDIAGSAVFNPIQKILSPILTQSPLPNAASSNGNIVGWVTPEFSSGFMKASLFLYGQLDVDYSLNSWYRQFQMAATGTETDILQVPASLLVSNFGIGAASNGYGGGVYSLAKMYFSTLETSSGPTTDYKLYQFNNVATGSGTSTGVYETQTKMFPRKITIKEVRVYCEPLATNNAFTIALIGGDGSVISNSSYTFTVGGNASVGDERLKYNPGMNNTYGIGVRVTNSGSANWVGQKIEIDWDYAGN